MIDTELSRTGSLIVKVNGKYTSSRVNPEKEAQTWIDKNMAFLKGVRQVIVIGIGSAIHVKMLSEIFDGVIYAIDINLDIVEYHKNNNSHLKNVTWLHLDSKDAVPDLLQDISYFNISTYSVLFVPAICANSDAYNEILTALSCRKFVDMKRVMSHVGVFESISKDFGGRLHSVPKGLISIKDLDNILPAKHAVGCHELAIFKLLRELVV